MSNPKILFVNLPTVPYESLCKGENRAEAYAMALAMPLGILYISSYIKEHNTLECVGLLDYPFLLRNLDKYNNLEDFILGEAQKNVNFIPDIIGISLMFAASHRFFELAIQTIKKLYPNAIIIVGGVHATNTVKFLLTNDGLDYVFRGEGEKAFSEIIFKFTKKLSLLQVKGLYSKENVNESISLVCGDVVDDLNELPFPDWELLSIKDYLYARGSRRCVEESAFKPMSPIMTTRGCPQKCTYCSAHTVHGRKVRFRSLENVLQEVKTLNSLYEVSLIIPLDDFFTANKKRVLTLLKELKKLNISEFELQLPNSLYVNTISEEIIDALIDCGTTIFYLAIESGSNYTQKNIIKKNVNLTRAKEVVRICQSKGVIVRCNFILGFPDETKELIEESCDYMKTLEADWCIMSLAIPLVGTEMYESFLEKGCIKENDVDLWSSASFDMREFDTEEITAEELRTLRNRINYDVNFVNNVNLVNGDFDRAISIFNEIIHTYPFHVFGLYGLYLALKGKGNIEEAKNTLEEMCNMIENDSRSKEMVKNFGYLLPKNFIDQNNLDFPSLSNENKSLYNS